MGYIPRREGKWLVWAQNFARQIAEDPQRYGLTSADAGQLTRNLCSLCCLLFNLEVAAEE